MRAARGKRIALLSALGVLPVLAAGGYLSRDLAIELWHLQRLRSAKEDVRCAAIRKLGAMRSARAVGSLLRIVEEGLEEREGADIPRNPADPDACGSARLALVQIGEKAVPAVVRLLETGDGARRELAAELLDELGPSAASAAPALVKALRDWNIGIRMSAISALEKIGRPAVPRLAAALEPDEAASWVPCTVAEVLRRMGPQAEGAVPALLNSLRDEDYALRIRACAALGSIGPGAAAALPALKLALGDPEAQVQNAAREAMARIGGEEV